MSEVAAESTEGLRVAAMVQSGNAQQVAIERAPGIFESRGIGNSYLVTSRDGDVLVNAGTLRDARRGREAFARVSDGPVRFVVLTQSHANQFGGIEVYATADTTVVAHHSYPEDRAYAERLKPHYLRGSRRIFGGITGPSEDILPTREIAPNLLVGDEGLRFSLGGRRFEIIPTPGGETRSAMIVWLPDERIAIVGNLFGPVFGNHPNLNTMRGDKPRWALQFIESAKTLRALSPRLVLTGHEAIEGEEHVRSEVTRIIDSVQWVHDRTVEGMNEGKDVRTLMREIRTPPELTLTEEYGKVAWNVRATFHEYTGWFDPSRGTTDLYGVPASSVAPAVVELAGGPEPLIARARSFTREGKPLEALHLLDIVLGADAGHAAGREARREALEALLTQTGGDNLWERRWIAAELRELAR